MLIHRTIVKSRNHLFGGVAALALTFALSASELSAAEKKENFTIGTQSVSSALVELATQSKVRIMASGSDLSSITTSGVSGTMTLEDALKKLLEGTKLAYFRMDDGAIIVKKQQKKMEATKEDGKKPVENGTSSVRGHVIEMSTGSNLAGALVKIVETGQTTRTNDLGNFTFPSVVPGNYMISISYLGFASLVTEISLGRGEEFQSAFSLGKSLGELDEIVVFGSRSARARALNLQRTAENNSSVVSADDLGNFTGTTISEALRRVAGVSFVRDPRTGEGTNIVIRGLAPDYNAIKLNGLNLPIGSGVGRSTNLNNLLADSVAKITIHKSLLPSHDSAGTGGLVEIETKSPLNRPHRYINLLAEGGKSGGDFGNDFLLSGTVSGTFGSDENFGLSVSVQYREQEYQTVGYSAEFAFGRYLPLESDGSPSIAELNDIDPRLSFPFEPGVDDVYYTGASNDRNETNTTDLAMTFSADWQVSDNTDLNLNIQRSQSKSKQFSRGSSVSLTDGYDLLPIVALDGEIRRALNWETGHADISQSYNASKQENITDTYSFRGHTTRGKWSFDYTAGYTHGSQKRPENLFLSLNFLEGGGFGGAGLSLDNDLVLPGAFDPVEGRIISPFGPYNGNSYPVSFLTQEGFDFFNDPAEYGIAFGGRTRNEGYNDRYTANFSTRYDFDQKYLKYLEMGVHYETSKSARSNSNGFVNVSILRPDEVLDPDTNQPIPQHIGLTGLSFEESNLTSIGVAGDGFHVISKDGIQNFFDNLDTLAASDTAPFQLSPSEADLRYGDQFTREDNLAAYLQGRVDIGKLEIIGGVRMNRTKTASANLNFPSLTEEDGEVNEQFAIDFTELREQSGTVTDILPRFQFNYRENDNLIFRASYFLSVARPSLSDLSDEREYSLDQQLNYGPDFNQMLLRISQGNPDLKPSTTHNFDFDIEYYHDQIGVIKIGAFYKHIKNLLELNGPGVVTLPDASELPDHVAFQNLPEVGDGLGKLILEGSRPENSDETNYVWGLEAHIERQFTFLPGFWNGFGVYANYTYTKSSRRSRFIWFGSPVVDPDTGDFIPVLDEEYVFFPFPGHFVYTDTGLIEREGVDLPAVSVPLSHDSSGSGTVALTYNKHNIDATLAYGFQGRLLDQFRGYNLNDYTEGVGTLDFRIAYYFEIGSSNFRAYFEAQDLLKGSHSPDLQRTRSGTGGVAKYYNGATYLGGRTLRLGLSATF